MLPKITIVRPRNIGVRKFEAIYNYILIEAL